MPDFPILSRFPKLARLSSPLAILTLTNCIAAPLCAAESVDISRVLNNPADLSLSDASRPDSLFHMGGGLYADDRDDLIDGVLEVQRQADTLEGRSRGFLLIPGDESELVDSLEALDGDRTSFRSNFNVIWLGQGEDQHLSWVYSSDFRGTGQFNYDEGDEQRLRFATISGLFFGLEVESHMRVSAVWQNYLGLNYRFALDALPDTEFGITGKVQNISLIERRINYADYKESAIFRFNRDVNHHLQLNADLGLRHQYRGIGLQLILTDIYNEELEGVDGTDFQQRSQWVAALDYRESGNELMLRAELTPSPEFGEARSRRDISLSGAIGISEHLGLTAAFNMVEEHEERNSGSLGFRYRLGELHLDAAAVIAGARELGFQLGAQLIL